MRNRWDPPEPKPKGPWGVYPHAFWKVTDHTNGDGVPVLSGPQYGYVVREITGAVPYGRMVPVRVYKMRHAADKLAENLNKKENT